jgi:hypothetical protein
LVLLHSITTIEGTIDEAAVVVVEEDVAAGEAGVVAGEGAVGTMVMVGRLKIITTTATTMRTTANQWQRHRQEGGVSVENATKLKERNTMNEGMRGRNGMVLECLC